MKNKGVSAFLSEMASLMELAQENRFKIKAYAQAATTIGELTDDVEDFCRKGTLTELPGIGQGIAEKIQEFCKTGKVKELETYRAKFPEGLLQVMQIQGMGPKRTRILFEKLKIDSLDQLKAAASAGKLRALEGFGEKSEQNILQGIAFHGSGPQRILLSEALEIARAIEAEMKSACRSLETIVPAGSLRRWKETIGDIDFLCISDKPKEVIQAFTRQKGAKQILAAGETKASIIHDSGVQCDLRVVGREAFGAALLYFTGSKEHNVALRELAVKNGLTINEYGLFREGGKGKPLASRTEEDIYEKLGLQFIPPELRENRGEIAAAQKRAIPKLIEEKDVRGDFHNHTTLSDGAHSLEQMAAQAKKKGWEWFVSADHSPSLKVARGLDRPRLMKKKREIEQLNRAAKGFTVLLGSEVDILADGRMDYDDATLQEIDFVVGSVHSGFKQTEEQLTNRILKAMENPHVDIIGHLTGRLIGRREAYPVNVSRILEQARRTQTALELNGQPHRLDLYDVHAQTAGKMGIPLVVSTDAHSTAQLDFMTLAVANARRAWLTRGQVLNCLGLDELRAWKRSGRAAAAR